MVIWIYKVFIYFTENGKLLYKLRGHDKSVISLSWCPASVNIFPKSPLNYVGTKKLQGSSDVNDDKTDNELENEKIQGEVVHNEEEKVSTDAKSIKSPVCSEMATISDDPSTIVCSSEEVDGSELDIKPVSETSLDISEEKENSECNENSERMIIPNTAVEEEPRKEFLLASSAKEG